MQIYVWCSARRTAETEADLAAVAKPDAASRDAASRRSPSSWTRCAPV